MLQVLSGVPCPVATIVNSATILSCRHGKFCLEAKNHTFVLCQVPMYGTGWLLCVQPGPGCVWPSLSHVAVCLRPCHFPTEPLVMLSPTFPPSLQFVLFSSSDFYKTHKEIPRRSRVLASYCHFLSWTLQSPPTIFSFFTCLLKAARPSRGDPTFATGKANSSSSLPPPCW